MRALVTFAGFGFFWGTWGAALPAVKAQAGVDDGELGIALLCIGAGALISMRLAGAVVDRFEERSLIVALAVFAGAGLLAPVASSPMELSAAALLVLGATSGAVDVAINSEAVALSVDPTR